jgi:DNA-directed RNA polymerase subunit RPC12/RpoP
VNAAVERCATCGALVDVEDLFCSNCGTEVPDSRAGRLERVATEAKNYQCKGCGATMNYDASARTLKCPFCGSVDLASDDSQGVLAPDVVIPFAFDRKQAEESLRGWLGSSFWHPNDLRVAAQLTELKAVYVPFWIFATEVRTHWTADSSRTPPGACAAWYPVSGRGRRTYDDLWIPAGSGVPPGELRSVLPFDLSAGVAPDQVDLVDVTVEQFAVSRRYARPVAQGLVESLETQAAAREVAGRARNVHVNVLMANASSRPALVPLYVMAYRYRDAVYRFVINGQTGHATGSAPTSAARVAGVVALVIIIALIILLLVAR